MSSKRKGVSVATVNPFDHNLTTTTTLEGFFPANQYPKYQAFRKASWHHGK